MMSVDAYENSRCRSEETLSIYSWLQKLPVGFCQRDALRTDAPDDARLLELERQASFTMSVVIGDSKFFSVVSELVYYSIHAYTLQSNRFTKGRGHLLVSCQTTSNGNKTLHSDSEATMVPCLGNRRLP